MSELRVFIGVMASSVIVLAAITRPAHAVAPDPTTCDVQVDVSGGSGCGQASPPVCVFQPDGSLDVLTFLVTVRDAAWNPIHWAHVIVSLAVDETTNAFCVCQRDGGDFNYAPPLQYVRSSEKEGLTDAYGDVSLSWSRVGGHGTLAWSVTVCTGNVTCAGLEGGTIGDVWLAGGSIEYTSPDLDATCDASAAPVDVYDLGIWVGGQSPYEWWADYNCDGFVDVFDLGLFAHGQEVNCDSP